MTARVAAVIRELLARIPRIAWAILAVALLARIAMLGFIWPLELSTDSLEYDAVARAVLDGNGFQSAFYPDGTPSAIHPPGFSAFLAGVYLVLGESGRIGQAVGIPLGVLSVGLIGLITWQLFRDRAIALIALGIAAVYPPLLLTSVTLLSESLFIPLLLLAVAATLHQREVGGIRWVAVAGALAGAAMLVRLAGVVLVLILALMLWRPQPKLLSPRALAGPVLAVGIALVIFSPWIVRNSSAMDEFVPLGTQSGQLWAGTYNAAADADPRHEWRAPFGIPPYDQILAREVASGATEAQIFEAMGDTGKEYAREHPELVLATAFEIVKRQLEVDFRSMSSFETELFGIAGTENSSSRVRALAWANALSFLALLALALVAVRRGDWRSIPWPLLLLPLAVLASTVIFVSGLRYRVPTDFVVIALASLTLAPLIARRAGRGNGESPPSTA